MQYIPEKHLRPDEYVGLCENAACRGEILPPPATRDELLALATARPDLARHVWPNATTREELDLPDEPHDLTAELSDREKSQIIFSVLRDSQFRERLRRALELEVTA